MTTISQAARSVTVRRARAVVVAARFILPLAPLALAACGSDAFIKATPIVACKNPQAISCDDKPDSLARIGDRVPGSFLARTSDHFKDNTVVQGNTGSEAVYSTVISAAATVDAAAGFIGVFNQPKGGDISIGVSSTAQQAQKSSQQTGVVATGGAGGNANANSASKASDGSVSPIITTEQPPPPKAGYGKSNQQPGW